MSRDQLPVRCEKCPLPNSPTVQGFGPGDGYVVVGEAPGNMEVSRGQPFVGQAGRLLRVVLRGAGIDPDEVYYTHAVLCHPPGNKTPGIAQIRCCNQRLQQELEMVAPAKILAVGGIALTAVMRSQKGLPITRWHGRGVMTEWGGRQIYTMATFHPAVVLRDSDWFRDFAHDILKWVKEDEPMPAVSPEIYRATSVLDALRLMEVLREIPELTLDLETTGSDPIRDEILSFGLGNERVAVLIKPSLLASSLVREALRKFVRGDTYCGQLAMQNGKFDIQFTDAYLNEYVRPKAADTMLLHYMLDERPIGKFRSHGLKSLARIHYDADDYDFDFKPKMTPERYWALQEYQALDLAYTAKLSPDLRTEMDKESSKLGHLVDTLLMPATYALAEVELHGVLIDRPYLENLRNQTEADIAIKLVELQAMALAYGIENYNVNSQPQTSKLIYEKWKLPKPTLSGKRAMEMPADSTAKDILNMLATQTTDLEIRRSLKSIVEFRLLKKVYKTYVMGILDGLGPDDRLRSSFRLLGTSTGRLSSAEPNIQNIPVLMGDQIHNAFIPSPGYVWVSADYSQLELRVAAALSDDDAMKDVFKTGRDIHSEVAAMIFKKNPEDVTKAERIMAKHVDFGILYGRSAQSLVDGAELEYKSEDQEWWGVDEAELFLFRFLNGFPKLKSWIEAIKVSTLKQQYVESPLGRRRRFPFIGPGEANSVGRQAVNTPIQGTASDICLDAMIKLHNQLPEEAYCLFPVHDAIYFEVHEDILEPVLHQIYDTMTSSTLLKTDVPFGVKIEIGPRWGAEEEWKP